MILQRFKGLTHCDGQQPLPVGLSDCRARGYEVCRTRQGLLGKCCCPMGYKARHLVTWDGEWSGPRKTVLWELTPLKWGHPSLLILFLCCILSLSMFPSGGRSLRVCLIIQMWYCDYCGAKKSVTCMLFQIHLFHKVIPICWNPWVGWSNSTKSPHCHGVPTPISGSIALEKIDQTRNLRSFGQKSLASGNEAWQWKVLHLVP